MPNWIPVVKEKKKRAPKKKIIPPLPAEPPRRPNPISGRVLELIDRPMKVSNLEKHSYLGHACPLEEYVPPPKMVRRWINDDYVTMTLEKWEQLQRLKQTSDAAKVKETTDGERTTDAPEAKQTIDTTNGERTSDVERATSAPESKQTIDGERTTGASEVKQTTNVKQTADAPTNVDGTTDVERIIITEFHCFPRLPIELRYKIWYHTLKPRLVMLEHPPEVRDYKLRGDTTSFKSPPTKIYTRTPLPIALQVSRDSRNAVLPMYPLCFHSKALESAIRFHYSLDTLFWNVFETSSVFKSCVKMSIFGFLRSLNAIETASLQNIAFNGKTGIGESREPEVAEKYWTRLATALERLHGLKNIITVHDIMWVVYKHLQSITKWDEAHGTELVKAVWIRVPASHWYLGNVPTDKRVDLFDEYPPELNKCTNLSKGDRARLMPIPECDQPHVYALHVNPWLDERTSHLYGWWYPKIGITCP